MAAEMTPEERHQALGRFLARIFAPVFEAALEVRDERPDLDDDAAAEEVRRRLGLRLDPEDIRERPRYRPFKRPRPPQ
jgi:hypothetical protein